MWHEGMRCGMKEGMRCGMCLCKHGTGERQEQEECHQVRYTYECSSMRACMHACVHRTSAVQCITAQRTIAYCSAAQRSAPHRTAPPHRNARTDARMHARMHARSGCSASVEMEFESSGGSDSDGEVDSSATAIGPLPSPSSPSVPLLRQRSRSPSKRTSPKKAKPNAARVPLSLKA